MPREFILPNIFVTHKKIHTQSSTKKKKKYNNDNLTHIIKCVMNRKLKRKRQGPFAMDLTYTKNKKKRYERHEKITCCVLGFLETAAYFVVLLSRRVLNINLLNKRKTWKAHEKKLKIYSIKCFSALLDFSSTIYSFFLIFSSLLFRTPFWIDLFCIIFFYIFYVWVILLFVTNRQQRVTTMFTQIFVVWMCNFSIPTTKLFLVYLPVRKFTLNL